MILFVGFGCFVCCLCLLTNCVMVDLRLRLLVCNSVVWVFLFVSIADLRGFYLIIIGCLNGRLLFLIWYLFDVLFVCICCWFS